MTVHEVAQQGFGNEAAVYERSRPSYPPDAVAWLVDALGLARGVGVVDLAAGTGKFTRLLLPTGADVIAVEPVSGMREMLAEALPDVPVLAATAESLPFGAGALDAVTVAQAFHWFDAAVALAELSRVLRPEGRLGVVWNGWDTDVEWNARLREIVDAAEASAPWRKGHSTPDWFSETMRNQSWFATPTRAVFKNHQIVTRDGLVERVLSTSHIAAKPPADRDAVLEEVRALMRMHPDLRGREEITFPYRVDTYWCERT